MGQPQAVPYCNGRANGEKRADTFHKYQIPRTDKRGCSEGPLSAVDAVFQDVQAAMSICPFVPSFARALTFDIPPVINAHISRRMLRGEKQTKLELWPNP